MTLVWGYLTRKERGICLFIFCLEGHLSNGLNCWSKKHIHVVNMEETDDWETPNKTEQNMVLTPNLKRSRVKINSSNSCSFLCTPGFFKFSVCHLFSRLDDFPVQYFILEAETAKKSKILFKNTSEGSPRNSFTRVSQFVIFSIRIFLKSLSLFLSVDSTSSRFLSLSFNWFFKASFSSFDALSSFSSCSQWVYKAKQKNLIFQSKNVKYLPHKKQEAHGLHCSPEEDF